MQNKIKEWVERMRKKRVNYRVTIPFIRKPLLAIEQKGMTYF